MAEVKGITVQIGGDTSGLSKALKSLNGEINTTQTELNKVNRLLKLDPTNTELLKQKQELLGNEITATKTKIESLKKAKAQADEDMKNGTEVNQKQYRELTREIESAELKLKDLETQASKSHTALSQISTVSGKISEATGKIAEKTAAASAGAAAALVGSGKAAVDFESAFAGVEKTVDATEEQLASLKQGILDMSTEMPASASEIAGVAEAAGQLGIATDDVLSFTKVMIDLGESTNLTAEEAASALAKFANITGTQASEYSNLGATIVDLGNNFATTESDIVAMSTRLASAGTIAGLSETDILALATAMSSVGIQAEAGGTAMTQTLTAISSAVNGTSEKEQKQLQLLGEISGMTAKEFAKTWNDKPIEAINAFIGGLGNMSEDSAATQEALETLGMTGVRQSNMIQSLALASDQLSGAVQTANQAWAENTALETEASKRYQTTESQLAMLKNQFVELAIKLGESLLPIIKDLVPKIQSVVEWFANLDSGAQETIVKVLALTAAFSPAMKAISGVTGLISKLTGKTIPDIIKIFGKVSDTVLPALGTAFKTIFSGISSVVSSTISFIIANPITLVIAAIVALVALIAAKGDEIQEILNTVDEYLSGVFTTDWSQSLGILGDLLNGFFAVVKGIWDSIKLIFDGIIDFIRGVFTGDWERAWEGVKEIFKGVFEGLVSIAKAPINAIIGIINGLISGINKCIDGLNRISFDIPDWVPKLGGKSFGFDLDRIGKIAYLAKGGTLTSGTAIVGEAGPEILTVSGGNAHVIPLSGERGGFSITMNNTFNGYDNAAGEAAARNLAQAVNRALGRAY